MKELIHHIQFGRGRDVIFLHGWGGSTESFKGIALKLSGKFRSTLVDFYGFGETPHPAHPITLKDYAQSIKEIIRSYNMEDVVLVGHSFGGRVAILLAAECPRIAGLVLIDSAGIKPRRKPSYYIKVYSYKLLKALGIRKLKVGSEDYRKLNPAMRGTFINVVNQDLTRDADMITAPTLIVWGEKDRETPLYMARKLKAHIADCRLNILEGAGHYSYLDNFNQFNGLLREFIEELPR